MVQITHSVYIINRRLYIINAQHCISPRGIGFVRCVPFVFRGRAMLAPTIFHSFSFVWCVPFVFCGRAMLAPTIFRSFSFVWCVPFVFCGRAMLVPTNNCSFMRCSSRFVAYIVCVYEKKPTPLQINSLRRAILFTIYLIDKYCIMLYNIIAN